MKRISAVAAVCALSIAAQDQPGSQRKHLSVATLAGVRPISLSAVEIERGRQYPGIIHLKGRVEIRTPVCLATGANAAQTCDGYFVLRAEEADFHEDTGRIAARGEVEVTHEK